jgi:hypothetical protein
MSRRGVFIQECPVCGRPLEIRREYHGKKIVCPQCRGRFTAIDALRNPLEIRDQNNGLLHRADELLAECGSYGAALN